jgi:hypothetical protein
MKTIFSLLSILSTFSWITACSEGPSAPSRNAATPSANETGGTASTGDAQSQSGTPTASPTATSSPSQNSSVPALNPDEVALTEFQSSVTSRKLAIPSGVDLSSARAAVVSGKVYFIGMDDRFLTYDLTSGAWTNAKSNVPSTRIVHYVMNHGSYLSAALGKSPAGTAPTVREFAIYNLQSKTWELAASAGAPAVSSAFYGANCFANGPSIVCLPVIRGSSFDPYIYTYNIAAKKWTKGAAAVAGVDQNMTWENIVDGKSYWFGSYTTGYVLDVAQNKLTSFPHDSSFYFKYYGDSFGYAVGDENANAYAQTPYRTQFNWLTLVDGQHKRGIVYKTDSKGAGLAIDDWNTTMIACGQKLYAVDGYGFMLEKQKGTVQPTASFAMQFDPNQGSYSVPSISGDSPKWFGSKALCLSNTSVLTWAGVKQYTETSPGSFQGSLTNEAYIYEFK